MKLSAKTRYAVRILFELSEAKGPLSSAALCERTGISLRAVENVHAVLKSRGITDAVVGAKGGLILLRPVEEISLGTLVECFDKGVEFSVCCGEKAYECPRRHECAVKASWSGVSRAFQRALNAISLTDLVSSADPFEKLAS